LGVLLCAAAGLVFFGLAARHQLEGLRTVVLQQAAERTGARLDARAVSANGLRGLRFEEPRAQLTLDGGVSIVISAPIAYASVDWAELLAGDAIIDELRIEQARIELVIPPSDDDRSSDWMDRIPQSRATGGGSGRGFRVRGSDCTVRATGLLPDQDVEITDISFDAFRMAEAETLHLRMEASIQFLGDAEARLDLAYAGPGAYDARLDFSGLDIARAAALLPADARVIKSGAVDGAIEAHAQDADRLDLHVELASDALAIAADSPLVPSVLQGAVAAQAAWLRNEDRLDIESARFLLTDWQGSVGGAIRWTEGRPELDISGRLDRYPAETLTDAALAQYAEQLAEWGEAEVRFDRLGAVDFSVAGAPDALSFSLGTRDTDGELAFAPARSDYPEVSLTYRNLAASFATGDQWPRVSATVTDGSVRHAKTKLHAQDLRGAIRFETGELTVDPLVGVLDGEEASGRLRYQTEKKSGEFSVQGAIAQAEDTFLHTRIRNTELSGRFDISATGTFTQDRVTFEAEVDGTRGEILHRWWLRKPPGIAVWAAGKGDLRIGKRFELESDLFTAGGEGAVRMQMEHIDGKWRAIESTIEADRLDAATAGASLRLPYRISGGEATDVVYTWKRLPGAAPDGTPHWEGVGTGVVSELRLMPDGGEAPLEAHGLRFRTHLVNDATNTADITLEAERAWMPSLGEVWFPPKDIPPELAAAYPPTPRHFTFDLKCDELSMPPWDGTDFTATAYFTPAEAGLTRYQATVDGGAVSGSYQRDRAANAYVSSNRFEGAPVSRLLQHLHLPPALSGAVWGEVTFSKDSDDPGTLLGRGAFEVRDGAFSADYLLSELDSQIEGSITALPPSLRFEKLSADIEFDKDAVQTPNARLQSPGIDVTADGGFVIGGELDYDVRVSLAPDVAERIPALRDSLSISGHRIAQQNIELSFHLTGTTGSPKGTLAEAPPVSVTVVTGGLEVIGDAVRVIDLPRKVLFDLLKIGGGIMGAGRPPAGDAP